MKKAKEKNSRQQYSNRSGNSGVLSYEIGSNYIDVEFESGAVYRYTYSSTGKEDVEEMKKLAAVGKGLTGFISSCVRGNYAARLK